MNDKYKTIDITDRTFDFGVRIVKLVNQMPRTPAGFSIGGQTIRSGTSIGANIQEAQSAHSRKEFIYKMNIALNEARETEYWLKIIIQVDMLNTSVVKALIIENEEIIKILSTIIKKTKSNS